MSVPDLADINLDCLDTDTLDQLEAAFDYMRRYAALKATAMLYRQRGDITEAMLCEAKCDATYRKLPRNWRW